MSNNLSKNTWIIGAGNIAIEYAKICRDLNIEFKVIGRGEESANDFHDKTGIKPVTGGLINTKELEVPNYAIVAVNVNQLAGTCTDLIKLGVKNILVEKPAGLTFEEIEYLNKYANEKNTKIYIAYNRRFFASVLKAKEIIEEDDGVRSFNFEFTEWPHLVLDSNQPEEVLNNWFLANSTHVVDMAFYLGGDPVKISSFTSGSLDWHQVRAFSGAGICSNNAVFSYHANWDAPGRWWVEVLTKKHRLVFKPMEKLQIQELKSVAVTEVEGIDYSLDDKYKPGFYLQTSAFYTDQKDLLILESHVEMISKYKVILGK
jgi:predicted dehydrogenase